MQGRENINTHGQGVELNEDEDQEPEDLIRVFSGASVQFNEFGHVLKVSLPTDYSVACITGLPPGTTPEAVVNTLCDLGFNLDINQVRIPSQGVLSETRATVKMDDPLFAQELSSRLNTTQSVLSAAPLATAMKRTDCRKVSISWHKAAHKAWLNFGTGELANRVAGKFNDGRFTCLGRRVKSSAGKQTSSYNIYSKNPVPWTITLSDIPREATVADIKRAITSRYDDPRHIEMGDISYQASDAEVSIEVRSQLEKHGPLESFHLFCAPTGKRVKATAWFQDEVDARSAHSLNDVQLDILGKGRLTVALVSSAKVKVPTAVYTASKIRIDEAQTSWKQRYLTFRVYPDARQQFTSLKVEGANAKDVAAARKELDQILSGEIITDGGRALWSPAFSTNGNAWRKLKAIEAELKVIVVRSKSKRQLRFHGSPEKLQQAVSRIVELLKEEPTTVHAIDLPPHDLAWAVQGGFKEIEQALGKHVAVFDVASRRLLINGTFEQHALALAITQGKPVSKPHRPLPDTSSATLTEDCPICFCEAENAVQTACKHTYCLECLEEYCKSVASTSKEEFKIKCQGDAGNCTAVFALRELNAHISSSTFEAVLRSSFEEYTQRHPETFRWCPTPECGFIYRCAATSTSASAAATGRLPSYVCPNCFESLCTSCHAQHGAYTCAEYKDIASGGLTALAKLKKQLNIKDCPKCSTPMEKTSGCNHMTCGGCKTHICWVCMAVFERQQPCYDHMNKEHGGIGLDYGYMD
ncbi:hypothetical protein BDV95DRAFT_598843 [Massariosphaeria phaeospora]|uniref:RING-type domain-containing protein n=1 Tax=Massariosphaeria phaeospora TaxID=100035 RepID=A0A7C8M2C4_9PLEO|nr:hypothetical protein BDV95DRAFT_598843 [Massariosphaeria phaeospora]